MNTIHTLFVGQWFPPEPVQVPLAICQALQKRGHQVEVLTGVPNYPTGIVHDGYNHWRPTIDQVEGFAVRRTPLYASHDSSAIRRLLNYVSWSISSTVFGFRFLRRADVALVYSSPATAALGPLLWRRITHTPFVLLVQDIWPDSVMASGLVTRTRAMSIAEKLLTAFVNATYRKAAHIAVISPGMAELLKARNVPADKISIVYNWADETPSLSTDRDQAIAEFGMPSDSFVVSYAGNHGAAQGLDVVINAAHRLRDLTQVQFLLVGDGLEAKRLRELAKSLDCNNVHFTGPVPYSRMRTVQAASDIQIISLTDDPLFEITMPSKVQSILASGTAAIAIAHGDAADVIRESGAGWPVRPGDDEGLAATIESASVEGPEAMAIRGQAGRTFYKMHMSTAVGTARLDDILRKAANSMDRPRPHKGSDS